MIKRSLCQEDITIINVYFPMTGLQIHEKKTNRKKREIGKSTIIWMSTASDQQCIEQLNKNSISKLTSYVKSTDSHSFFFYFIF